MRDLRQHPQRKARPAAVALVAKLRQVALRGHAQLQGQALQQNRHQVREHDDEQQRVAETRPAGDVGGPVAGIHVAHRDQKSRPQKPQQPPPVERRARDAHAGMHLRQGGLGERGSSYDFCGHSCSRRERPQDLSTSVCHRLLIMVNIYFYFYITSQFWVLTTARFNPCSPVPCSLFPVPVPCLFRPQPNRLRRRPSQDRVSRRQLNQNGLIVVLAHHAQALPGPDAGAVQKPQQLGIALLQADHGVAFALRGLGQLHLAAPLALRRTLRQHRVAVRAGAALAQFLAAAWPRRPAKPRAPAAPPLRGSRATPCRRPRSACARSGDGAARCGRPSRAPPPSAAQCRPRPPSPSRRASAASAPWSPPAPTPQASAPASPESPGAPRPPPPEWPSGNSLSRRRSSLSWLCCNPVYTRITVSKACFKILRERAPILRALCEG